MGAGKDIRYFSLRIGTEDRFIMVDARTDLKSPYVLFADTNGNLRFSDEKAYLAKSIPEGWFGTDRFRFGPVTLTRQEGSRKIAVSFHVSTTEGDNLSIYPFQYLRGELSLAGAMRFRSSTAISTAGMTSAPLPARYVRRDWIPSALSARTGLRTLSGTQVCCP
jgi:hypothetical protein